MSFLRDIFGPTFLTFQVPVEQNFGRAGQCHVMWQLTSCNRGCFSNKLSSKHLVVFIWNTNFSGVMTPIFFETPFASIPQKFYEWFTNPVLIFYSTEPSQCGNMSTLSSTSSSGRSDKSVVVRDDFDPSLWPVIETSNNSWWRREDRSLPVWLWDDWRP